MHLTMRYVIGLGAALTAIAQVGPEVLSAQDGQAAPGGGRGGRGGRGGQPAALVWAPKPTTLTPYDAPHRPLWKLADVQAMHKGQANWRQPIIREAWLGVVGDVGDFRLSYTLRYQSAEIKTGEGARELRWASLAVSKRFR